MIMIAPIARADFTPKDAQVLGRTLHFSGDGLSGTAIVGVVFAPESAVSHEDADAVQRAIGDSLTTGRLTVRTRLLTVEQLSTASGIDALYVTRGLTTGSTALIELAKRLHIPTLSNDPACLAADLCVVGFSSTPTVEIVIDRIAAERAGVTFVEAFRMLVREK